MFLCLKMNKIKSAIFLSPSPVQYCLLECLRHAKQLLVFCLDPIIAFSWRAEILREIIMIVQIGSKYFQKLYKKAEDEEYRLV